MARPDTDRWPKTAQIARDGEPSRDLVVIAGSGAERASRGHAAGRCCPRAEFLAQILVSADPTIRQTRVERTRLAAMRYAESAKRRA